MSRRKPKSGKSSRTSKHTLRLEALEPRQLLSTMQLAFPGDVASFVFKQTDREGVFDGDYVMIELRNAVTGVGSIELIGMDAYNGFFTDVPGLLNGAPFAGGLAGDPIENRVGNTGENEVFALAANPLTGDLYGFSLNVTVNNDPNLTFPSYSSYWDPNANPPRPVPTPPPPNPYAAYQAAFLVSIDPNTGVATRLGVVQEDYNPAQLPNQWLVPPSDEQFVYNNIVAADFDGTGNLWAIGQIVDKLAGATYPPDAPAGNPPYLIRIDPTSRVGTYENNVLITISPFREGTNAATAATVFNNLADILTPYVNGDQILITGTDNAGNPVNAVFTFTDVTTNTLGNLVNAISAAFPDATASIDASGNIMVVADNRGPGFLALTLADAPGNTGQLTDWSVHTFRYVSSGNPGPNECWVVERYPLSLPGAQFTSIAWDEASGRFYGYDSSDNHIKTISLTGVVVDLGYVYVAGTRPPGAAGTAVTGITALEIDESGTLYGVNTTNLYEISKVTDGLNPPGLPALITGVLGHGDIAGLAYDPNNASILYGVRSIGGGADEIVTLWKKPPKPMDLYSVYITESDQYTEIIMSVVVPQGGRPSWNDLSDDSREWIDMFMWNAPNPHYVGTYNNVDYFTPAGAGGVMVGALPRAVVSDPLTATYPHYRYKPVWEEYDGYYVGNAIGTWPGSAVAGTLYAGIMGTEGPDVHARGTHTGDLGYVLIAGTLAGRLGVDRSLEVAHLGFLYGSIDVGGDLRTVYIQTDAGALPAGDVWFPYWDDVLDMDTEYANNVIHARGTITDINVRGVLYANVVADGYAGIPTPGQKFVNWNNHKFEPILEHEGRLPEVRGNDTGLPGPFRFWFDYEDPLDPLDDPNELDEYSFRPILDTAGNRTVTNNTIDTAQYIASETGNIIVWGYLDDQPDEVFDYYALPLQAGQTVRIHGCAGEGMPPIGHVTDPRLGGHPFNYDPLYDQLNLELLSPDGLLMGTFGYETIEDQGIGSRGTVDEDLVFTAPEAGVYYIKIGDPRPPDMGGTDYSLFITGATPSTIGGIEVNGNIVPYFNPYDGFPVRGPEGYSVYVGNGNLGAIYTPASTLGVAVSVERGSIASFESGQVGYIIQGTTISMPGVVVQARDNIGRVQAHSGSIIGSFLAGADTGNARNYNASVQNVVASEHFGMAGGFVVPTAVISSGSIGVVRIAGTVAGSTNLGPGVPRFQANYDGVGGGAFIDLIEAGGDWGDLTGGRPRLYHGTDGNVRFVHVAGDIYEDYGGWVGALEPTVYSRETRSFADDGGATTSITAVVERINTGTPQAPIWTEVVTTVQYWIIDVDDATGGVMARFQCDGDVRFATSYTGAIEISDFFLSGTNATDVISISGGNLANFDVYYLHGSPVLSFINSTAGDIVSGNLQGITNLITGGSIGYTRNATKAWVNGHDPRPAAADPTTFGWFLNRTNGVQITGTVALVQAGGSLGDLFVNGTATRVVVNADRLTAQGNWDGVRGTVFTTTRLGYIDVGDGLADDGSAAVAQAGIFSFGTIGTVAISRRYEFLNDQFMGLINGAIIAEGAGVTDPLVPVIEGVIGTNGARLTALVLTMDIPAWLSWGVATATLGGIGTISFSGAGSAIFDAEISGDWINTVSASANSEGIWGCYISAQRGRPTLPAIGLVEAGGPGLRSTVIGATGGSIGTVRGIGPTGDVVENFIESTDSLLALSGRHIYGNEFNIPNFLSTTSATGNVNANTFLTGGMNSVFVAGDVLGNTINVAGPVYSFVVRGEFSSELTLQGPRVALLNLLDVFGPLGGTIISAGKIGTIISRTSSITADITTTPDAINGDIDRIQAARAFLGNLSVSGTLGLLSTVGDVGKNPELIPDYEPTVINVTKDVRQLLIRQAAVGTPSHIYSDLNIGGNLVYVYLEGGLFGDTTVTGNVETFVLRDNIGRDFNLGGPIVTRGNVGVRGYVRTISLAPGRSILADFITGGDITNLTLTNGNIGRETVPVVVQSLFGDIGLVSVTGGSVYGQLLARMSIGTIRITNGQLGTALAPVTIQAANGGISNISVVNGSIFTTGITAGGGPIRSFLVSNTAAAPGNVAGTPGAAIRAETSLDSLNLVNTNLSVNVTAGSFIRSFVVSRGNVTGVINGETAITNLNITGDLVNATVRSGGLIQTLTASRVLSSIISSAVGITNITTTGNVAASLLLAGYDVGPNGLFEPGGVGDDNPLSGGAARAGNITSINIGGAWDSSVVALGVEPLGGSFLAATVAAPGESRLRSLTIRGDVTGASGVVADTALGTITTVAQPNDPDLLRRLLPDGGNPTYNAMALFPVHDATRPWTGDILGIPLTITLGGPGLFKFDPATATLAFVDTTSASSLNLRTTFGNVVPLPITVVGGDDDALATLTLGSGVTLGPTTTDGAATTASLNGIAAGSALNFLGGLGTLTNNNAAALANVNIRATGRLNTFRTLGAFTSGSLIADSIVSLSVTGDLGATLTTTIGGISTLLVQNGTLGGNVASRDTVASVRAVAPRVGGVYATAISGNITVERGDLTTVSASGDVTSNITVQRGAIRSFTIVGGDFSNLANPADMNALRALTGIGTVSVSSGDFSGVLFTRGALTTLSVSGGTLRGHIGALDGINSIRASGVLSPLSGRVEGVRNALLASGADIASLTVTGDMVDSYVLAGFNPNDDGYDAPDNNKDDAWLDSFAGPEGIITVPADEVWGGTLRNALVTGDFIRSAMGAGVGPGEDGFLGNADDVVAGTGYILNVNILGQVVGTPGTEAFGFRAATRIDRVMVGGQPLGATGNIVNTPRIDPPGPPHVTGVNIYADRLTIGFDQPIDLSTIRTAWFNGGTPSLNLYISPDANFTPADFNVATMALHQIDYTEATSLLTLTLLGDTWTTLNAGTNFLLVLDSTVVADASGELLDGDYLYTLPSGDGLPGADFIYRFAYGDQATDTVNGGDTRDNALELLHIWGPDDYASTSDWNVPMLVHNQPSSWPQSIRITGEIGDNPTLPGQARADDTDFFTLDARAGDILYFDIDNPDFQIAVAKWDGTAWVDDGEWVLGVFYPNYDSISGAGLYTEDDTTYALQILNYPTSRALGSYELIIHLFNDHNSNFSYAPYTAPVASLGFNGISAIAADTIRPDTLYAIDNDTSQLLSIDTGTGAVTVVAALPAGYSAFHALEFDSIAPLNDLWAVCRNPANALVLVRIDELLGTIAEEHALAPGTMSDITSIAFDSTGVLYGVNPDDNTLVTIDITTGAVTVVAQLYDPAAAQVITGVTGIAFDANDTLYAVAPNILYTIDPTTAQATRSDPLNNGGLSALAFDPSAFSPTLWSVDSSTAPNTLIRIQFEGDITQTPTLLQFVGGVARPEQVDRDGHLVQVITAPDDLDVYSLGQLAAGTHIDVTLLTRTIGSYVLAEGVVVGVFNSNRETVASLYSAPEQPIGGTYPLESYEDLPIISVNLPTTDTYYVAIWGGDLVLPTDLLPYDLSVAITAPAPAPQVQAVFLSFDGGNADYLAGYFGPGTDTYLDRFEATLFGFYAPTDRQTMINQVLAKIRTIYGGYANITFTTNRPLFGEYATVLIGADLAPEIGTMGIAEHVDPLNGDLSDMCVVFAGEVASYYHTDFGYTMDDVTTAIANLAAHELGHLLGLNHQEAILYNGLQLIMSYADPVLPAAFGRAPFMTSLTGSYIEFPIGYQNDDVLLRVVA